MRVVFMGTPEFAVPSLCALAETHDVIGVYTRPDAVSGRGGSLRPSPVKTAAVERHLPVSQPATLRDPAEQEQLRELEPDIVVVAAYGLILPREVLEVPPLGCVNVHASLLPRWRGAAPVERAILAGDAVTGVSIMRMEEGLDTGPFCEVERVDIDDLSSIELTGRLATAGSEALARALAAIEGGTAVWTVQDDSLATYAAKMSRSDVALGPDLAAEDVLRRVRASSPHAPSRLCVAGQPMTALVAAPASADLVPGAVTCTKRELLLGCADGAVALHRIKPDGRGEMDGCAWARGARIDSSATWEASS